MYSHCVFSQNETPYILFFPVFVYVTNSCFTLMALASYRISFGDSQRYFCSQSLSNPLTYAVALNYLGASYVHQHLSHEPSGGNYSEIRLDRTRKLTCFCVLQLEIDLMYCNDYCIDLSVEFVFLMSVTTLHCILSRA